LETFANKSSVHFIYYDNQILIPILRILKSKFRYPYYYIWQWFAYRTVKNHHEKIKFDYVHHITWVQVRMPSFMWKLNIPFIVGPVGGGEKTPWRLWPILGLRQWLADLARDIWSVVSFIDPFVRSTYKNANKIFVTSTDSLKLVPKSERKRSRISLAIALDNNYQNLEDLRSQDIAPQDDIINRINIIYVGRFLGWKGMGLGIYAFSLLLKTCPNAMLTMVGSGPEEKNWKSIAKKLGIENNIIWISWIDHKDVMKLYDQSDLMLFPSMHDSGGFVVLEALSRGVPVVCLDLGGPGTIIDSSCGIKIDTRNASLSKVKYNLYLAMRELVLNREYRVKMSRGAIERVKKFNWDSLVESCYRDFKGNS
ncbi:MAG: glycosyltransferase, partial [Candidatus Thiodiazotropha sp.]